MFDLSLICNSTLYFSTAYKCRKWDLCTCDGLPTRKTYRKTTMCCKHLLWVANSNTVTTNQQLKNIYNQNITVGTSHNKHLSWATVATFLDDNFGVFLCFYLPVSNYFVFIPIFTISSTLSTQNMQRRPCSANMKLHEHIYR